MGEDPGQERVRVSVIVPVRDRAELLGDTLQALAAQTYTDLEVIVIDDGSVDGSADVARAARVAGRPVRVLEGGGNGAVAARQLGVAAAQGDILAFTDSDCVPSKEWVAEAMRAFDEGADMVNGKTAPARLPLPLERSMGSGEEGLYPTCNMFYRRSAYDAAGGFDGQAGDRWGFRPDRRSRGDGFGEDTLLAWRVIRAGHDVRYVPAALVEHAVFAPDLTEVLSRTARVAAFPAMVREVPELRSTLLRWRWQLGGRTRLPVYGVALAALTRRRGLVALLGAWWVGERLAELRHSPLPWGQRLRCLPAEMAIDVVTAGALVAGSARARSITL
jgi:cellulose synthase/poly-beta-1,6-N-acetylglucosamine synthase-like glycosyltransferase